MNEQAAITQVPPAVRRPVLAPGLRVLSRSPGELEIGLSAAHRLRVTETPAVRRVLAALDRGETPRDTPVNRKVLAQLAPVLRDAHCLMHPALEPAEVAAAVLRHRTDVRERLRSRTSHRVRLSGDADLLDQLDPGPLLRRTGLVLSLPGERASPAVALVVAHGEPDRATLDPFLRAGTPHLLLRLVESEVVLGPFVVPGRTACLRCIDAHTTDVDGGHPRALTEYSRAVRHDGVAEPVDAAVAAAALGWAVADLVRFSEQDRPTTWSSTLAFASGRSSLNAVRWLRHPRCGCSWGVQPDRHGPQAGSVTMGA